MIELRLSRWAGACLSMLALATAGCLLPQNARAGSGSITGTTAGSTPFISNVSATYSGSTLSSVNYAILQKTGSLTRPLTVSYSAQYLTAAGNLQSSSVTIPVFGLYAGYTNTVTFTFYFTDGSQNAQSYNITTAAYTDTACPPLSSPTFTQGRINASDLNFDLFIVKQNCGANNNPVIVDTDGNIRWVGLANATSAVAIYNNVIYLSDGATGILAMPLTTATPAKIADFSAAPYNVTFTGHHNIDPGRDGLIDDVNTTTQTEAVDVEFNPSTGAVLNTWDLGQILTYTMTKGGDNASKFVLGTSADWFHNNSTTYNPADNTLIVSSRENFVIAVDYDTPSDGQKKIHWILGDTGKAWYQYPSLRAFMLTPANAATLAPMGQHAVSIDHLGNLLLFDDGFQSLTQSPAGTSRTYSAVREYEINTSKMTATQGPIYYSPSPTIFNPICGSIYDVNNTFLVDFPTDGATASLTATAVAVLQGLGANAGNVVFNLQYAQPSYCSVGWNSYPIPSDVFTFGSVTPPSFTVSANPSALTLVEPQSGGVSVSVMPVNGFTGNVALTASGFPAGVTYAFSGVTATSSTLTITAGAGTMPGTYPITITGTSGTIVNSSALTLMVAASPGFTLSDTPGSLSLTAGSSNASTVAINSSNGFGGSVSLAVTGLPMGVTAGFATNPATASSLLTVTAARTAALGTSILTITGSSGGLSATTMLSITVGGANSLSVNMTPSFNVYGIFGDGTIVTNGGLDTSSYAYSANLLGASVTANGVPFSLATPAQADATSGTTVMLPSGKFNSLNFLGTAIYGAQANQVFVVHYTDGTTSMFTQSMSDWGFPQSYPGESVASSMAYREAPGGGTQSGPWNLYAYSFALNNSKAVQSIVLPPNRNVVLLAITLSSTAVQTINFPAIASQVLGTPLILTATASSGLPVTFTSSTTAVCTVSGTTTTFLASGTCTVTASQAGTGTYAAAAPVTQSFAVSALQTIKFATIPTQTVGTSITLSATASSGLPVSYSSLTTSVCTTSGATAMFLNAGTCTITASQSGNGTYAAAAPVSQSFTVASKGTFSIAVSAAKVTVTPPICLFFGCFGGTSGEDTITVTPVNGFSGAVTFSISGLPTGVTATFNPTSVSTKGTTTLTLTPASNAAKGASATLTIVSSSGSGSALIAVSTKITLSY